MPDLDIVKGIEKTLEADFFKKNQRCIVFVGPNFQPNLFWEWRKLVIKSHKIKFQFLASQEEEPQTLSNHSWISAKNISWLGEVTKIESIPVATENHIAFFCSEQKFEQINFAIKSFDSLVIKTPKTINYSILSEFLNLIGCNLTQARMEKLKNAFSNTKKPVCFDNAIELSNYFQLSSIALIEKTEGYIDDLIATDNKFFQLPGLLFSGKWKAFFDLWDKEKTELPTQFWVSFWTNCFFKACFVKNNPNPNPLFLKSLGKTVDSQYFKKLSLETLKYAIFQIYKLDHDFKNGIGYGEFEAIFISIMY